jgi:hypothetical protein
VQIHHINGDSSDNSWENLAILCHPHHDKATAPRGLTAQLKPEEIVRYKKDWEEKCKVLSHNLARGRTAFFMVDYKNAERIRQLYSQLTRADLEKSYKMLKAELIEEYSLRKEQGFLISLEPTTSWSPLVERLVEEIKTGNPHPSIFNNSPTHPKDPYYPLGPVFANPAKPIYDIWCQIMIRVLIISKGTYDLENLAELSEPELLSISGSLVTFYGKFKGNAYEPAEYIKRPSSQTLMTYVGKKSTWESLINIKTHYVYSDTAAYSLSHNHLSGVLLFRSIEEIKKLKSKKKISFSCSPLIIGVGNLKIS